MRVASGAGLVQIRPRAYLPFMLRNYLSRFNLVGAYRDARVFFGKRRGYEWKFALASAATCAIIVWAFFVDSYFEKEWHRPEIIYVQSWRLDRTDAQIESQQKIDQAKKESDDAKLKQQQDAKRKEFQNIKDKYGKWL